MDTATLIVLCVTWLLIAGTLIFRLIRPRPASRGSRWMGFGLLIIMTMAVISSVATSLVIQARNGRT